MSAAPPPDTGTGLDLDGTFLHGDRGGRRRNAARGRAFRSLDLFARRRVAISHLAGAALSLDVSVAVENLLDSTNYTSFGSVIASPLFEQPVAARPGRSFRLAVGLAF